jgi:outer membrane immunogenic protein
MFRGYVMRRTCAAIAVIGVTAALAGAFTSANAGGPRSLKDEPYREAYRASWAGLYIGVHAGGAWANVDWDNIDLTGEAINNDSSGFIGGGQVGYNWQSGHLVFGIEASLSGADLEGNERSIANPAVTYSSEINSIVTVTGRLGYAADGWLIYGKAGWANARVEVSGVNTGLGDAFSADDRRNGWTVGAGLEYLLAPNVSLGLEYSFIDLGRRDFSGTTDLGLGFTASDVETEIHSVTARLNIKFGSR